MTTPAALEVCPFCGSDNVKLRTDSKAAMSWVACISCGLEAPTETGVSSEEAVAYWNRRAARSTAPEAGKAVDVLWELHRAEHRKLGEMLTDKSPEGREASNWQGGKVNGIGAAIEALSCVASVAPSGAEPVAWRRERDGHLIDQPRLGYAPLYASPQAVPAEDVAGLVERLNEKHAAWQKLCDRWIAKGKADGMDIEDDFTALRKTTDGEAAAALTRVTEERDAYIKACDDYERDLKRSEAEATSLRGKLEETIRDRDEKIARALNQADIEAERAGNALNDLESTERKLEEHRKALEHVRAIISEGAMVGFNPLDGTWAERLYASQGMTHAVLNPARGASE